jgi:hypothetical protein
MKIAHVASDIKFVAAYAGNFDIASGQDLDLDDDSAALAAARAHRRDADTTAAPL